MPSICTAAALTPKAYIADDLRQNESLLGWQMAVYGNFSGHKAQEVMVSRGSVLELLRPDEAGHMQVQSAVCKLTEACCYY